VLCCAAQLGEKAGGRLISDCKQKQEQAQQAMQHKIKQLKRAKQNK
jgi:hypothetical protein